VGRVDQRRIDLHDRGTAGRGYVDAGPSGRQPGQRGAELGEAGGGGGAGGPGDPGRGGRGGGRREGGRGGTGLLRDGAVGLRGGRVDGAQALADHGEAALALQPGDDLDRRVADLAGEDLG